MAGIGPRWPRILAALLGFLGVAAGAFGAHGLRGFVAPEQIQAWETAASYQLLHAVALLAVSGWQQRAVSPRLKFWLLWACGLIVAGVVLFSGSLYLLVLTGIGAFGPITPLGGVALLAAWMILMACGLAGESHAAP